MGIKPPTLIGVTVLTSINDGEWKALGYDVDLSNQVVHLAMLAKKSGLDGVVLLRRSSENSPGLWG